MTQEDYCPLCRRPLGERREKHHLVPRSHGGRDTVMLHPICHRAIHTTLSERDLAREFDAVDRLRAHPEIAKFLSWVANKAPDFYRRTEKRRR